MLPRISIVTPSFNQGRFIESTIQSILDQGYPNLEYIIIDGGSTDNTLDVIRKYENDISYWTSEPDSGMYDAINKGFAQSTGEIMAWSPTGDLYKPGALKLVGRVFARFPQIEWLTSLYKTKCDEAGNETDCYPVKGYNRRAFVKGLNFPGGSPYHRYTIQQQSTFWRRGLWERAGGRMDAAMQGAGDFELWCRFYQHAELVAVERPIGVFRSHEGQTSVSADRTMCDERATAFHRNGGRTMGWIEGALRDRLLRRRPFACLRQLPGIGYRSSVVRVSEQGEPVRIEKLRFV